MKKTATLFIFLSVFVAGKSQNVGIGTISPQAKLSVGNNSQFRVDSNGNIIRINNVPASFPLSQGAAGQTLVNDGGGDLKWGYSILPNTIVLSQAKDTSFFKSYGFSVFRQHPEEYDMMPDTISSIVQGSWSAGINTNSSVTGNLNFEAPVSGNNMYTFGFDSLLYQYNLLTNTYSPLPGKAGIHYRFLHSLTIVNNEVYVFGGYYNLALPGDPPDLQFLNDGAKYNLSTQTWAPITTAPYSIAWHSSIAIANDIYFFGGANSFTVSGTSGFFHLASPTPLYKYNTISGVWQNITLPARLATRAILQGNTNTNGSSVFITAFTDTVYDYNPSLNTINAAIHYSLTNQISNSVSVYNNSFIYKLDTYSDTISYVPPGSFPATLHRYYKIDLSSGQTTELNGCQIPPGIGNPFQLSYYPNANTFLLSDATSVSSFNDTGTNNCQDIFFQQQFWYYMRKN